MECKPPSPLSFISFDSAPWQANCPHPQQGGGGLYTPGQPPEGSGLRGRLEEHGAVHAPYQGVSPLQQRVLKAQEGHLPHEIHRNLLWRRK